MDDLGNPDDEEMCEPCGCGHSLGQHAYGDDVAPCDFAGDCGCYAFHGPWHHDLEYSLRRGWVRCCVLGRIAQAEFYVAQAHPAH